MNENSLITLESGSEDEALNLLKDFNVKVLRTASIDCWVWVSFKENALNVRFATYKTCTVTSVPVYL